MNKIFTTLTRCVAALLCLLFIDQIVASAGIMPMLPGLNLPVLKNTATTKPTLLKGNAKRLLHAGFKYPGAVTSAPSISYSQPGIYSVGTPITPLSPVNIGGDVPAISYLQTSTIAGGFTGYVDSTGTNAKFNQPFGTASDASRNIYVADYGNNVIRKITPAGVVTTFAGSGTAGYANGSGSAAKFNGPIDLVIDASGNLYVADANNNMIRKITAQGMVTTVAGKTAIGKINGTSAVASFDHPHGITMDGAGNIFVADYNNNLIRKITSAGIVSTVAGSSSSGAVDGQGISASFYHPSDVAVDALGVLYVADNGNNTIRAISTDGVVSTFAGSASVGSSDGTGITARFNGPFSVVAYLGDIYVADNGNNEIRKINSAGEVQTIAGAVKAGSSDGIGTKATFNNVRGLSVDASGNMIVAAGTIRKISLVGYAISPVLPDGLTFDATTGVISGTPAGVANTTFTVTAYNAFGKSTASFQISIIDNSLPPSISYPSPLSFSISQNIQPVALTNSGGLVPSGAYGLVSDYPGTAIDYSKVKPYPRDPMIGLAIDSAGTLYVADHSLNVIRKVSTTGVYSILAGSGTAGSKNGTGAAASFSSPWSVALDRAGNTYVADEGNNLIRKVTPAGVVSTFAGSGAAGAVNDQGTAASFNAPHGIACDASGNLYVADYGNNLIRKITPTGMVTTLAGRGTAGSINGTGTAAAFKNPYNLTVDKSGNVFVTDYGNNIIRKITPDGIVSTLAGSGSTKPVNGTGTEAGFLGPVGITVDNKTGNVYVSDGNSYIRKITPSFHFSKRRMICR